MSQFAKHTSIVFIARILIFFTSLASSIVIARLLGPEGRGMYALLLLIPAIALKFSLFGIDSAEVYYIGKGKYSLRDMIGNSAALGLLLGMGSMAVAGLVTFFFHGSYLAQVPLAYFFVALGTIPLTLLSTFLSNILLGAQRFFLYSVLSVLSELFFLGFTLFSLFALKAGVFGLLWANILSTSIVALAAFFLLRAIANGIRLSLSRAFLKDMMSYGLQTYASGVLGFLYYRADILLINAFLTTAAVGYYSLASSLAEKLLMISTSAVTVFFPRASSEKDERKRKEFTPLVSRHIFFLACLAALALFIGGRWIILLLYSASFLPTLAPLYLLLPGIVAMSVTSILAHDYAGRGRPILNVYIAGYALVMNVALNLLFIPRWGMSGAAFASSLSYISVLAVSVLVYRRISGNSVSSVLFLRPGDFAVYKNFVLRMFRKEQQKNICMLVLNDFTHDSRVLRAARALQEAGYQVFVFAVHEKGLPVRETNNGVVTMRFPLRSRALLENTSIRFVRNIEFMVKSLYHIWRLKPVACHCNDLNTLHIGYASRLFFGIPFVYDSHELQSQKAGIEQDPAWLRRFTRFVEHFFIQRASRVITIGDYIAEHLAKQDSIEKPVVIRNIADVSSVHMPYAVPLHFGFPKDWKIVLYQGALQVSRGLLPTIRALAFLPEEIVFVLVGDGPLRKELEQEAKRLSLNHRILFQGWVPPDYLLAYTKEADLGIMSSENVSLSYYYTLPSKLFEYIAAGLPMVGSDFPEIRRIIDTYAIGDTFDSSDPKDIARAIRHVIDDPLRYQRFRENAQKASLELTWHQEKEKLIALYSSFSL